MSLHRLVFSRRGRVVRTGVLVCLFACAASMSPFAQSKEPPPERKVITRVEPKYPSTLERMYIGGIVRLRVDIAADGTVEGAEVVGGNPILGQAAIVAVKQWKYAPANHKTQQVERLEFDPHQ